MATITNIQPTDAGTYYSYSDGNNYLVDPQGLVYNLSQGGAYQVAGLPAEDSTTATAAPVAPVAPTVAPTSGLTIISQQTVDGDTYYRYSDGNNYLVDASGAVYNLSQGGAYQVAGLPAAAAPVVEQPAAPAAPAAPVAPEPVNPFTPIGTIGGLAQPVIQPTSTLTLPGTLGPVAPTPVAPTVPTTPATLKISGRMYQTTDPKAANYVDPAYNWTLNPATGDYFQSVNPSAPGAINQATIDYYAQRNQQIAAQTAPAPLQYITWSTIHNTVSNY